MARHPNPTFASVIRQAHWVRRLLRLLPMGKLRQQMRVRKGFQWYQAQCRAMVALHRQWASEGHHKYLLWEQGMLDNQRHLLVNQELDSQVNHHKLERLVSPEWDSPWVRNPACSPPTHH